MLLHVICIAYERPIFSRIFIDCFLTQSDKRWDMTFVHDGPASEAMHNVMELYSDPRIKFIETEKRLQNWGHEHRRVMLQLIEGQKGDYVLITNNDNYYVPRYVEYMLREARPDVGMIYCNFLHHNFEYLNVFTQLKLNHVDMGAYITEIKLAQNVGFQHDVPGSDGLFAEDCSARCKQLGLKTIHIEKTFFVHN